METFVADEPIVMVLHVAAHMLKYIKKIAQAAND
jgi:hypothetical protein